MKNQQFNFTAEVDLQELTDKVKKEIYTRWKSQAEKQLMILFADKKKSNDWIATKYQGHPELGKMFDLIDSQVQKFANEYPIEKKVNDYLEKYFDQYLEEAMSEALTHQTRKLAFNKVGLRSPRQGN